MTTLDHDTIRLDRVFSAPPHRVFDAYADPSKRVRWVVPSEDEILVYSTTDFFVGGTDHFICGPTTDPAFAGSTHYEHIEENALIVCHERIRHDGRLLSLSTITWTFDAAGDGTRLTIVDQVTAIDSTEIVAGHRIGYSHALTNLSTLLQKRAPL